MERGGIGGLCVSGWRGGVCVSGWSVRGGVCV